MSPARDPERSRKLLLAPVAATLLLAIGCQPEKGGPPGPVPTPYLSSEVPILVFLDGSDVIVVPKKAYLRTDQTPHWIALQGTLTGIIFNGSIDPIPNRHCGNGHCYGDKPSKEGTFDYTVTLTLNSQPYRADPQLIIGK